MITYLDGTARVDVRLEQETVWLTQWHMSEIVEATPENVLTHLNNVFGDGEWKKGNCQGFLSSSNRGWSRGHFRMWLNVDRKMYLNTLCHIPHSTDRERTLKLARRRQGVTARELAAAGIHRQVLSRLVAAGEVERIARGIYRLSEYPITEHHGLAVASTAVPHGVVCLLSALQFHGIGMQLPSEVWIAIDRRARRPALKYPPLHIVRYSGKALTDGIETHQLEGQPVRVYNVAKTLADCFKYRNKIGLDVALEALREAWRARRFKMAELDRYAGICRVQRVMRPYLEVVA